MSPASMSDLSSSSMKKGLPSVSVYMASSSSPCARGGTVNTARRRAKIAYIMALTSLRVRGPRADSWGSRSRSSCVGTGTVRWETLALQKKEALSSRVGLRLGHQARFADPRFAGKQNKLPLAAPRSINEQAQCRELGSAANQDRAKDWGTEERLHSVCHLLIECSKSRVLLPPRRRGREGFSSQVVVSFSDATFVFRYQRSHLPALHSAALFGDSYASTACEWSAD